MEILQVVLHKNKFCSYEPKSPPNSKKLIGVEIEKAFSPPIKQWQALKYIPKSPIFLENQKHLIHSSRVLQPHWILEHSHSVGSVAYGCTSQCLERQPTSLVLDGRPAITLPWRF